MKIVTVHNAGLDIGRKCEICGKAFEINNYSDPRTICPDCINKLKQIMYKKTQETTRTIGFDVLNFKVHLAKIGISTSHFANKHNICSNNIYRAMRSGRISVVLLHQIAEALGVDIKELIMEE